MRMVGDSVTVFDDGQPSAGSIVEVSLSTVRIRWSPAPLRSGSAPPRPREAWFHALDGGGKKAGVRMGDQQKIVRYASR